MVLADDRRPSHDRLISAHSRQALSRFSTRQNKAPQLDRVRTMNRAAEKETRRNADEDRRSRGQPASGSCIDRRASRLTQSGMREARTPKSTSRILGGSWVLCGSTERCPDHLLIKVTMATRRERIDAFVHEGEPQLTSRLSFFARITSAPIHSIPMSMEQRHLAKREYKQAHRSNSDWLACAVSRCSSGAVAMVSSRSTSGDSMPYLP